MSLSATEAKGRSGNLAGWELANDLRRVLRGVADQAARQPYDAARQDYYAEDADSNADRIDALRSAKSRPKPCS
jgi:hypothetical protein